ncbi:MAG: hypothetical protein AAFR66_20840 [Bacteroidota bacterium]
MKKLLPLLIVSAFALGMLLTFATISFSTEKNTLPAPPMKRISAIQDNQEISSYLVNQTATNAVADNSDEIPVVQSVAHLGSSEEEVIPATTR